LLVIAFSRYSASSIQRTTSAAGSSSASRRWRRQEARISGWSFHRLSDIARITSGFDGLQQTVGIVRPPGNDLADQSVAPGLIDFGPFKDPRPVAAENAISRSSPAGSEREDRAAGQFVSSLRPLRRTSTHWQAPPAPDLVERTHGVRRGRIPVEETGRTPRVMVRVSVRRVSWSISRATYGLLADFLLYPYRCGAYSAPWRQLGLDVLLSVAPLQRQTTYLQSSSGLL
jgi:hypothetical protein